VTESVIIEKVKFRGFPRILTTDHGGKRGEGTNVNNPGSGGSLSKGILITGGASGPWRSRRGNELLTPGEEVSSAGREK